MYKFNNPLILKWLTSNMRGALKYVAGVLTAIGFLTGDEADSFAREMAPEVAGLLLFAGTQGYSMWVKWWEQKKFLTAAAAKGPITENQVEQKLRLGDPTPAASTPKNVVPVAAPPAAAGQT